MGIGTRFWTDETCDAEVHVFVQGVVEKKQTTLVCVSTELNKAELVTKCHTFEAHMNVCAMLGVKLNRDDGEFAGNSHSDVRYGTECILTSWESA